MEAFLNTFEPVTRTMLICGVFIFLSTWCTLYNKFIFEHIFPSSNCLLLVQNISAVVVLLILRKFRLVDVTLRLDRADIICGACYALNVMTGLWSLVFVNIAMFGCLKRCTVVASWVIELLFARTNTTMAAVAPIVVMTVGTIVASYNDLMFHAFGYALAAVSCVAQGSAFELGRRVAQRKQGVAQVLYANSVVAVVMQIVMIYASNEAQYLAPSRLNGSILFHFALNSISCLAMNYSIFLNCLVNSPLAHAVTGNIKAAFTTLFGVMIFEAPLTIFGWAGVIGNFYGAGWFSYLKHKAGSSSSRHHDDPAAKPATASSTVAKIVDDVERAVMADLRTLKNQR